MRYATITTNTIFKVSSPMVTTLGVTNATSPAPLAVPDSIKTAAAA
jgi:hypothetical protein